MCVKGELKTSITVAMFTMTAVSMFSIVVEVVF